MAFRLIAGLMILWLTTACTVADGDPANTSSAHITLVPYATIAPTLTDVMDTAATITTTVTPEPLIYTVKSGDSLSVIAYQFGVDLADLRQANPGVDENAMSIGMKLVIPLLNDQDGAGNISGGGVPTPVIQSGEQISCYRMDNEYWICFQLIFNDRQGAVENVVGKVQVPSSAKEFQAINPLDFIPPGASVPLVAIIQIESIDHATASIVSAIDVPAEDVRYGDITVINQTVTYGIDKRSVEINGELLLPDRGIPRLVAYAINQTGQVSGYRIWEGKNSVSTGKNQVFHLHLYSMSEEITEVHLVAQAKLQ
ncbi:MAG: LysM peptidoglycan-binding domain-containing protein [Anaerolineaceae bacterium]|nr:LysM peptidoglycan-binding domain-containing protein [Anaerolineaceae bacterium]